VDYVQYPDFDQYFDHVLVFDQSNLFYTTAEPTMNRLDVILSHVGKTEEPQVSQSVVASDTKPQTSVISEMHPQCCVCVIKIKNPQDFPKFAKLSSQLPTIVKKLAPKSSTDLPSILAGVGFGTAVWNEFKGNTPGLGPYKTREGKLGSLPYTPYDIVVHVKAVTRSLCYDVIDKFVETLPRDEIESIEDRYGWQYQEGRDLSGFIDGTMNTVGEKKRGYAALNKTGGSFLIHQVWEHDLDALKAFSLKQQETMVGRLKNDSVEHTKDMIDPSSHVTRMRDENFNRIPIVRQSMPFGSVGGKRGLLFIAYSNDVSKFDKMLDRMTDSVSDSIMKYSKCISGNYYYFPSQEELSTLGK
jgi:putative iron-dependent peroxidase